MENVFKDPKLELQYHEGALQVWYDSMYVGEINDRENLDVQAKEAKVTEMVYYFKKERDQQGNI